MLKNVSDFQLVFLSAVSLFLLSLAYDSKGTIEGLVAFSSSISNATQILYKSLSDPSKLIQYGIFYIMVTIFPKIPDAVQAALLKGGGNTGIGKA